MTVASRTTSLKRLRTSSHDPQRVGSRHVLASGSVPETQVRRLAEINSDQVHESRKSKWVQARCTPTSYADRYYTPELVHRANYRLDHRFLL
jgi:hypothetical protein